MKQYAKSMKKQKNKILCGIPKNVNRTHYNDEELLGSFLGGSRVYR